MAGIAMRMLLQIILMLFLRLPEIRGRGYFGYYFSGPFTRGIYFTDQLLSSFLLLFAQVKNCRSIRHTYIITLTILSGRVMDLKEKFQQLTVRELICIELNRYRFCMG